MNAQRRRVCKLALGVPAVGFTVLASAGCAALDAPQTRALRQGAEGPRAQLHHIAFFPQTPFHCGPAALATVLDAAGFATTPDVLAAGLFIPAREGSLQVEMLAAARRVGAMATRVPGQLTALMREVQAGHPVLVLQNLGLAFYPRWHYAVVVGHDLDRREFTLRSGTEREQTMGFNVFEHTWARSGHWAIVVRPPGQWPVTARVEDAEASAVAFERMAPPALAFTVYRSLLLRWPNSLVGSMGQGNVELKLGEHDAAANTFARAAAMHDSAAAFNNLAIARARRGDTQGAVDAAEKAVARATKEKSPLSAAALDTLATLRRGGTP